MAAYALSAPGEWSISPLADKNAKIQSIRSTEAKEAADPFAEVVADWAHRPDWEVEHYPIPHSGRVFDVTAAIEFIEDSPGDEDLYAHFLRVDDITLVNRNHLPHGWSKNHDSRGVIYMNGPIDFVDYLIPVLIAMQVHRDLFKNAVVEDIGSGNGELALVALALGASRVVGIDIKSSAIANAMRNWKDNPHLHARGAVQFLRTSIENWFAHVSPRSSGGAKRILLANLGPIYEAYGMVTKHVADSREYFLAIFGGLERDSRGLAALPGIQNFHPFRHFWRLGTFSFKSIYTKPPFSHAAFAATQYEAILASAT